MKLYSIAFELNPKKTALQVPNQTTSIFHIIKYIVFRGIFSYKLFYNRFILIFS